MNKKVLFLLTVAALAAASCNRGGGSSSSSASSGGGSSATVREGTPAPASAFTVQLTPRGDGVQITDYNGNAKSLTIPATIEDLPVVWVNFRSLNNNVEQVFIPEGVKQVGFRGGDPNNRAGFPNLSAVSLPSTLERISSYAFEGCINIKSITIPSGVTYIGENAFKGIGIQSIAIPASVNAIDPWAFRDCKSLTYVEISGNDLELINMQPFMGCDSLKTVIINEGVIRIGDVAFIGLKLLETVKLPDSLTIIGERAFTSCSSLRSIVIPKGIRTIGADAFASSGLTEVSIPKTSEPLTIMTGAFRNCQELVTVNFEEGATITFRGIAHFSGCPKLSLRSQAAIREHGGSM